MSNIEQYKTEITIEAGNLDYSFTGTRNGVTTEVTQSGPLVEANSDIQQIVEQSRAFFAASTTQVEEAVTAAVEQVVAE